MNIFVRSCFTTFGVDYQDKNALMNLNLCMAMKPPFASTVRNWCNELNCGQRSLKDEVREAPPRTVVVRENIDAVRELIMQDRHVTYREIKASLGSSSTSIHSILPEHQAVKKICWIPHNLAIA